MPEPRAFGHEQNGPKHCLNFVMQSMCSWISRFPWRNVVLTTLNHFEGFFPRGGRWSWDPGQPHPHQEIEASPDGNTSNRTHSRTLDYSYWIEHFHRNRLHRAEPDWSEPLRMSPQKIEALRPSIVQFQLGDGGGECRLLARDAERFRGRAQAATTVVDLWFREEAEHARLLSHAVARLGGKPISTHWSYEAFCLCRRRFGVRFELQVLTLTELVSTGYYRLLQQHVEDPPLERICALILRDEAGHVAFQRARLQADGVRTEGVRGWIWKTQFWICGLAAATVLWSSHGRCLKPLGATTPQFLLEVIREIGGFVRGVGPKRRDQAGS